jgi:hypothetical protein
LRRAGSEVKQTESRFAPEATGFLLFWSYTIRSARFCTGCRACVDICWHSTRRSQSALEIRTHHSATEISAQRLFSIPGRP